VRADRLPQLVGYFVTQYASLPPRGKGKSAFGSSIAMVVLASTRLFFEDLAVERLARSTLINFYPRHAIGGYSQIRAQHRGA
jgi:hypothetical protein